MEYCVDHLMFAVFRELTAKCGLLYCWPIIVQKAAPRWLRHDGMRR